MPATSERRAALDPALGAQEGALLALARLLEYPGADWAERLDAARQQLGALDARLGRQFQAYAGPMEAMTADAREELYSATFDLGAACPPYVSIHLFGEENFKRGEFMAALRRRHEETGFCAGGELPDHVANLLSFAARTGAIERRDLAEYCLLGPLRTMAAGLGADNPCRALLETARALLQAAWPELTPAPTPLEQRRARGGGCEMTAQARGCGCAPATAGGAAEEEESR